MLPKFEQHKVCPVCTAPRFAKVNAETACKFFYKFHKGIVVDGMCVKFKDLDKNDGSYGIEISHIHVTCSRCTYEWIEQTALAQDEEWNDYD